jgi:glycosyltransferase involved in cell wall biosynthesis
MRILQVNKFHYPRGGADKYYLELGEALEKAGHKVAYFSMRHPKNIPSSWDRYFVSRLSFNEGGIKDKLKAPGRIIYSLEAKSKFKKLVLDFKPDIIHIHNIYHQLSPSILDVAKKYKIPVVMHLHDYKLICPNYQLFCRGQICEACKKDKYFNCVYRRCFKNSLSQSLLAALEMTIHHKWLKIYKKNISLFIAPSNFMKNKVVEYGWDEKKIRVVYNSFSASLSASQEELRSKKEGDYLFYFGRLSSEKGLSALIKAATLSKQNLKIAGVGPCYEDLKKLAISLNAPVEFLGFKTGDRLKKLIMEARAVVLPSIWYENMPLSLLEALSLKTIVIASLQGGMPEIIKPGYNGFLFEAGNVNDLATKIKELSNYNLKKMRENAYLSVSNLNAENNLNEVMGVYQELI